MHRTVLSLITLVVLLEDSPALAVTQQPPRARRMDHVDVYHGVRVADPYRWMEEMDGEETQAWARAQDTYARAFAATEPTRNALRERVAAIAQVVTARVPFKRGDRSFHLETPGTTGGASVRLIESHGPGRLLIDGATLTGSESGVALSRFVPDDRGTLVAYSVTRGGSRWEEWRVREVSTGRDLADTLTGVNGGRSTVIWVADGSGFFYERFPMPAPGEALRARIEGEQLFFHRLGTPQATDQLIYDPGAPDRGLATSLTVDARYLVIQVSRGGSPDNSVIYRDLSRPAAAFRTLVGEADAPYTLVGSGNGEFWFYTTRGAPRGRVVAIALDRPEPAAWRVIVPEAQETIDTWIGATAAGGRIFVGYRKDAALSIMAYESDGRAAFEVPLPKLGSVWSFTGRQGDPEAFYSLSDFTDPGTIYRLDTRSGRSTIYHRPALAYDPDSFVIRQVFYQGKDGTRIPMFLAHRRDIKLDGNRPALIYGYGAFAWAASPWFQPQVTAWLQLGGVFALPNTRGGGEYGEAWHEAGIRRNKQTAIDDFLTAAEWLVANRYTTPGRLVINGGSAGGPLVGAAIVQRPELFAAGTIDYPALDMLRLDQFTGGRSWRPDFGSTEDPADTRALLAYSPYHNVREGVCYPAVMIAPGDRDEITVPMHAYKFAAALQHAQACSKPVLMRVAWGAGHAAGATLDDSVDAWADQLAFLVRVLRLDANRLEASR